MALSDHDRKMLWSRSGNMCARCHAPLVLDASAMNGVHVVVGVEAHIVSQRPGGPRHRPMLDGRYDTYHNVILVCPTDHTVIDTDVAAFPESALVQMKQSHEAFVSRSLQPRPELRVRQSGKPTILRLMSSGSDLLNLTGGCEAGQHSNPEPLSRQEAELMGSFLETVFEYGEVWDEIGPGQRLTAGYELNQQLKELRDNGLVVYAGTQDGVLEGDLMPHSSPWQTSVVQIRRADDPEILQTNASR